MNRVHKHCPKIDSGTIPSHNGSKIGRVHRVHTPRPAQAPRPHAPRAPAAPAAARPCACCSAPAAARLLPRACCCAPARPPREPPRCCRLPAERASTALRALSRPPTARPAQRPSAHACAPACACCAPVPPASALATRPAPPVRAPSAPPAPSACSCSHNTILYCDTLWPPAAILQYNAHCKTLNFFLQYNTVYCNMKTLKPATIQYLYCNTLQPSSPFKLQYNLNLAIPKFPFSQYKIGSSPSKFSAQIFFFVFHYK